MNTKRFVSLALIILVLSPATIATAANKYWKNSVGSGNWSGGNNWSNVSAAGADNGGVPAAGDVVHIIPTDGAARTITYDVNAPPLFVTYVDLTGPGINRTTFEMSANTLTTQALAVGYTGRGTFNHSGGTVNVTGPALDMAVGEHSGSNGIYNLSGAGALSVAHDLFVGRFGTGNGTFNQTGGTTTIGNTLSLGTDSFSTGTYTISGGTLSATNSINVGNPGIGTLTIQGSGSASTNSLTISAASTVNLNGGTLRFNTIGGSGGLSRLNYTAGTIQLSGNRTIGSDPIETLFYAGAQFGHVIPTGKTLAVEGEVTVDIERTLQVIGGQLNADALHLDTDAEVILKEGGTLRFNSFSAVSNTYLDYQSGTIQLPGNRDLGNDAGVAYFFGAQPAIPQYRRLVVDGIATLSTSLTLTGGTLSVGSLVNNGSLQFGSGTLEITGPIGLTIGSGGPLGSTALLGSATNLDVTQTVTVNSGAHAVVAGGFSAGNLVNNGDFIVIDTAINSPVVNNNAVTVVGDVDFNGSVSGPGDFFGPGTANFHGGIAPGASPSATSFEGNVTLGSNNTLFIEIGGTAAGTQFDQINVDGQLTLGGALHVSLISGFTPSAGQAFDVFDWGSLAGTFSSISLPTLPGLTWNTSQLDTAGILSVASAGLPGDFIHDGTVDAADYVIWRKTGSPPGDYSVWRTNFGRTLSSSGPPSTFPPEFTRRGGPSTFDSAVPEPSITALAAVGLFLIPRFRRVAENRC
jgi:T5SS/PEP-CTERM-associated repeat protein